MYMGTQGKNGEDTHCTAVYLCTSFSGTPKADGQEMHGALFLSPDTLDEQFGDNLFPPFADSLKTPKSAQIMQTFSMDISDGCGIMEKDEGREDDGPNSLPYGLCKREGIDTEGLSPSECWEALEEKTGKSQSELFAEEKQESPSSESTSKAAKSPADLLHLRPLKEGVRYNAYDFSDEIKEYEATYPKAEREAAKKRAAERSRFKDGWESHDMDEVIHRLLKSPKIQSPTKSGKVSFISDETPLYVCYDLHSDYFTVIHKNKRGKSRYHGVNGEPLLNYRDENVKTHGMPKGERMKRAHFNRRK